jgi:hypothetical protein
MKLNLMALGCAFLLALGLSSVTFAGSITDDDGDGVPNGFDNCTAPLANGPLGGNACGQYDFDADGYGNACDADYDNNGVVDTNDLIALLGGLGGPNLEIDSNCNGVVDTGDLIGLLGKLGGAPGPSDLGCAGSVPCP